MTKRNERKAHVHYWNYPNTIWEGRWDSNEVAVMRYCACGVRQCAFASNWGRIPKSYQDMKNIEKLKP